MKKICIIGLLLASALMAFSQTKETTSLTGNFSHLHDQDTVQLLMYKYGEFPYEIKDLCVQYTATVINKQFTINIPLKDDRPYECRLIIPRLRIYGHIIIIQKGDHLHISGTDITINDLKGKGAEKTNIIRQLDRLWNSPASNAAATSPGAGTASGLPHIIAASKESYVNERQFVDAHLEHVDIATQELLNAYAYSPLWEIYNALYWYSSGYNQAQKDSVQQILKQTWLPLRNSYYPHLDAATALYDMQFARNMIVDYALRQIVEKQDFNALSDNAELKEKYLYFKNHFKGLVREKIITLLILSAPRSNDVAYCYDDAKKFMVNNDFRSALDAHCQSLPGTPAYNFLLLDSNKVVRHLKDYKGKVLVFDFWFTGCGNCRELTPKLRQVEERYKNDPRVQFISISSDKSFELWKTSIRSGLYTTSASEINLYTAGKGMEDPLYKKTNTFSAPTLKLIDGHGNWCESPVDCRNDDGKDLTSKIDRALMGL